MQLIDKFVFSSYRCYSVSRKQIKKLSTFSPKHSNEYLDYSVDFSKLLKNEERLVSGEVKIQGQGLVIENIYIQPAVLTAFISGGMPNRSFYLTFMACTDQGSQVVQEMILSTYGYNSSENFNRCDFLSLKPNIKPPMQQPPLNAIKINNRYLLDGNGFFIGI